MAKKVKKVESYMIQGRVFTSTELDGALVSLSYIGHPIIEGRVAEFITEELTRGALGTLSRRTDTGEWIFVADDHMPALMTSLINLGTELNSVNKVFYTANDIPQALKDYRNLVRRQRCGRLSDYKVK